MFPSSFALLKFYYFWVDNAYTIRDDDYNEDRVSRMDRISLLDGRWTSLSPFNNPRRIPAVTASEDSLRVFGGSHNGQFLSSCEQYNIIADK